MSDLRRITYFATVWFAAASFVTPLALGAEADAAPAKRTAPAKKMVAPALDDALFKDLENDLLEGAGDLKDRPKRSSKGADPAGEKNLPGVKEPGEDVGVPGEDADPLVRVSQEMRSLESLISGRAKGETEAVQRQIIADLEKLIQQAEKQSAAQQSSSSKDKKSGQVTKRQSVKQPKMSSGEGQASTQPAQDSNDKLRQAEAAQVDPAALKGMLKDAWGNLPARAREQMLQNSPERFLPQYELMIEKYYKRLAEEQHSK
jgi:hypothetical protein